MHPSSASPSRWLAVLASLAVAALAARAIAADEDWPQWRGPLATGEAPHADPPIEWSEERGVRWKVALPGVGHSSPIVHAGRIYITIATPVGERRPPLPDLAPGSHDNLLVTHEHEFRAMAFALDDGEIEWETTLRRELPHEGGHVSGSYASASPATDGERLIAYFGSRGLYALDLAGELQWKLDLGDMATLHGHGEGSSPVLARGIVVVNWDHEGQSFVCAVDVATGEERWRKERDEVTSWASPIAVEHDGRTQVVVSGTKRIRAYDLLTGEVIWECGGLSKNVVASPVAAHGMVFAGSSYDTQALVAIRLDGAKGDVTTTDRVAWRRDRWTPYVPSPVLTGGSLYFLRHYQGIVYRVDAKTGREVGLPLRLDGISNVYSSLVAAAGRVYVTDRSGVTAVFGAEDRKILATNRLDDRFSASAALVGRSLILRGERFLYRIEDGGADARSAVDAEERGDER